MVLSRIKEYLIIKIPLTKGKNKQIIDWNPHCIACAFEEGNHRSEWLLHPHQPFYSPVTIVFVLNKSLASMNRLRQQ